MGELYRLGGDVGNKLDLNCNCLYGVELWALLMVDLWLLIGFALALHEFTSMPQQAPVRCQCSVRQPD